ncbi:hypothetical protein PR202_ga15466 [Eleusine coracana subsp. coracana]|uniref:DUF1664 domain-containing protein n=1 Tax=Eleusine coracana subsp. coracana TaxID=191504 RepID=A0AAV5CJ43_ELECO|nr:hypothetical protein PR202_ga15466 [Eleusine coracana subsp. coracana]
MAMATQTGFAASKVLILVGAGMTGSILLRNGRLSDVLGELQELMKGVNQGQVSGPYDIALIQAQGLSLSDVMFVTKRNMANAVQSMSKQLELVSSALAVTKRHLTQRLENLDGKMDEQVEVSKTIRNEVNEVKDDISQNGFDIEEILQMVSGLEGKIELLEEKQDMANAGIRYLCQFAGGIKDGINAKFFQEASEKPKLPHPAQPESEPVKGLEWFLESAKEQKETDTKPNTVTSDAKKPMKVTAVKSIAVHRSTKISFRKEGLAL